jgi:hypothetical protein
VVLIPLKGKTSHGRSLLDIVLEYQRPLLTCSNSERFYLALSLLQGHTKGLLEVLGIPAFKKYDRYSILKGKEGGVVQEMRSEG